MKQLSLAETGFLSKAGSRPAAHSGGDQTVVPRSAPGLPIEPFYPKKGKPPAADAASTMLRIHFMQQRLATDPARKRCTMCRCCASSPAGRLRGCDAGTKTPIPPPHSLEKHDLAVAIFARGLRGVGEGPVDEAWHQIVMPRHPGPQLSTSQE